MALHDVLATVVEEKSAAKGEKKHYIPFNVEEFGQLRDAFENPGLMPNDIKLILLAVADGRLSIYNTSTHSLVKK